MINRYFLYVCLLAICLNSCSGEKQSNTDEEKTATVLPDVKSEVRVISLKKQTFNHELVSNGKISANGFADLHFLTSDVIAHIWVKNGDRVQKGQKLAELDKFRLVNKLTQTKNALDKAQLDLRDVLIGQGYASDDLTKVPEKIMKLAKVKSGYEQTKAEYELAKYEMENATLKAPFDGVIANLFTKPYNTSSTTDTFCTLIDMQSMKVDFTVLENELSLIKNGDKVVIAPYANASAEYIGNITEINPLVDNEGMVKVKARVNGKGKLFSGMNVRVSVCRSLGKELVIPKSAVVLRSGKQVVFTLKNGKAQWNYIHTSLENSENYSVADGLKEKDVVIITGNVNLAHEAPVTVTNKL